MNDKTLPPSDQPAGEPAHQSSHDHSIVSSFFAVSEKLADSRPLRWTLMALLPVLILIAYPVNYFDYDMWWQMALGKYYLTHHTPVVDHSIFSWTPADPGWIYNTFLGSTLIYLIYSFGGGFGLWLFQWFIFIGVFLSFYFFLRLIGQRLDVTILTIIAAIGIACSMVCSFYKPELFSTLLFCWMVFVFFYVKVTRKIFFFYFFPLIFALWINLHGAFSVGLIFLFLFLAGEIFNRIFFPQESFTIDELLHFGAACLLSVAATLLNPYGIHYLTGIYHGLTSENYDLNSNYISAYAQLWPYLKDFDSVFRRQGQVAWIFLLMMIMMGSALLVDFIKKKSCDFAWLFVFLLASWGSMRGVRGGYLLPFIFFFSFLYFLNRFNMKLISRKATIISLLIFIFFILNVCHFTVRYGSYNRWFGAGLDDSVPVREVEFLKTYQPEGPLFNDYLIGGYLLWALYPDYKVFIDPRLGPYYRQIAPDYWALESSTPTVAEIVHFNERYPFKTAIIHYNKLYLIFDFVKAGWKLVYFERNAAVLVHPSLLSRMPREMQSIDLGPRRFQDETNPQVLLHVFTLYVNLYPQASPVIHDFYRKNVSDWYKPKADHLRAMEGDMRQRGVFPISR